MRNNGSVTAVTAFEGDVANIKAVAIFLFDRTVTAKTTPLENRANIAHEVRCRQADVRHCQASHHNQNQAMNPDERM